MIIHRAIVETRGSTFEAFSTTPIGAVTELMLGLARHGAQHNLRADWADEFYGGIEAKAVILGKCYRDGEVL